MDPRTLPEKIAITCVEFIRTVLTEDAYRRATNAALELRPHKPARLLYTHNVGSSGRHPKKPIADALAAVARPGLRVDQIHKGHRWGVLVCEVCGDDLSLWSTPSVPEHVAKRVHRFAGRHRHEEDR